MSMIHKAYVFAYDEFTKELSEILEASLTTNNCEDLIGFIKRNITLLKNPNDWIPLTDAWEASVEPKDAHQYGNVALTKFYNPLEDIGLEYSWMDVDDLLQEELFWRKSIILGHPVGSKNNYFDPGKLGSYFQSPERVLENLDVLKDLLQTKPDLRTSLNQVEVMLQEPARLEKGLYVTF
ncbi:hypothetical protein K9N68_39270 (plasmid) [Kovacikia minuta CCNUW1]|uniref:hypothetical protein n=1 Tax=Kovacikia minuta TaxID=2931930 RepID=UPI001CCBE920|nr:hypothetical protein [Kovacikia minuta]UBF30181.1 hypothetical protein K9N68_39270 [Kovacikia minuta CCNUW1]